MTDDGQAAAQRLVSDYLQEVREATTRLSPPVRTDLFTQLEEHIRDARSELDDDNVSGVRAILHSLGTPAQIAAAAFNEPEPPQPGRTQPQKNYDLVTVLMLSLGALFIPIVGWLVGVVMLWRGPRWTRGDKILGSLVWPLGPSGLRLMVGLLPSGGSEVCTVDAAQGTCLAEQGRLSWLDYVIGELTVGLFGFIFLLVSTAAVCLYLAKRSRRFDTKVSINSAA
jgi:hypothetical protein